MTVTARMVSGRRCCLGSAGPGTFPSEFCDQALVENCQKNSDSSDVLVNHAEFQCITHRLEDLTPNIS